MLKRNIFLLLLLLTGLANAQLKINELMTNNISAVWDDSYNYSMWVELYNPSETVSYTQSAYYFTDDLKNPKKWKPSYKVLSPKSYSVLWFEHDDRSGHASFKLNPEGGKLYLINSLLAIVDSVEYPVQFRNVSYGRITDGAEQWSFFDQISPAKTNNNKKGCTERCSNPIMTLKNGFYTGSQNISFESPAIGDTIYYTLNGEEPKRINFRFQSDTKILISKTTVLRAKTFSFGKMSSDVISATYFINERKINLPVASIITEQANLTDNMIGLYVQGTNGLTGNGMDVPANWNQDWDRPANFELFDTAKIARLNQELNISIAGGWSRKNPQKSLKINPNKKFGNNKLNYDFFTAKPNQKYKSILLRNSGNDFFYSMLRDGFMNTLVEKRMNIDCIAYEPAVCFMNGVYYGIQNLRERSDFDFIYSNYGLDEEDVLLLESGEIETDTSFAQVNTYITTNDITKPDEYSKVCDMIDIESFINYFLTEIYYANTDWPNNNIKVWKLKTGGKWRWILYDTDFGYNLYNTSLYNHNSLLYALGELAEKVPPLWSTNVLKRLLLNDTFRKRFISNFSIHISSTFETKRANRLLDSLAIRIKSEIVYHKAKWTSYRGFESDIENMKTFSANRPNTMLSYISNRLVNSAAIKTINVSCENPNAKYLFNNESIIDASIDLKYFENQPFTLEAKKIPGYKFKHWELNSQNNKSTLINFGANWNYFDGNAIPASNWNSTIYSDASWSTGISPLGYGDRGEATKIGFGGISTNKNTTAYFRKSFTISNLSSINNILLSAVFDDGIVVYINGVEVGRDNLPTGTLQFSTLATTYAANNAQTTTFTVPKNLLVEGNNIVAVEIHQNSVSSSDLFFNLQLTCEVVLSPTIHANALYSGNSNDISFAKAVYEQDIFEDPDKNLKVYINEIVSGNNIIPDEFGGKDDYIEIFNDSEYDVNIAGWYITDTPSNRLLAQIPITDSVKTNIPAKGRIIVWADDQPEQGVLHVKFKLSKDGETIVLSKNNFLEVLTVVDSVSFPVIDQNLSFSRVPDASDSWIIQKTTFYATNGFPAAVIAPDSSNYLVYPTAFNTYLNIQNALDKNYRLIDLTGKVILAGKCNATTEQIELNHLKKGMYIIQIGESNFKIVKL